MLNRRRAIKQTALAVSVVSAVAATPVLAQIAPPHSGAYALPYLPYPHDALEPYIDKMTMQFHHDRHHAAYVAGINKALADYPALGQKPIEELLRNLNDIPEAIRTAVRNQGGGHANHVMLWQAMKPGGSKPSGELLAAINKTFGDFAGFQAKFTEAATKQFGSGWAWLSLDAKKNLAISASPNQDSPYSEGSVPLLGMDVWEHAYYLKYQNRRPEYIDAFYHVINWDFVGARYTKHVS
jgi:Fe-Mn family superoxide dismutase